MPSMRQVAGRPSGKKKSMPRSQEGVCNVALQVTVGLEVAEHERLRVGAAFERDPGAVADAAVGAVAADEVPRMDRSSLPCP